MNSVSGNVKNYLINTSACDGYVRDLYKVCLELVKLGLLTVMITSKTFDFSELVTEIDDPRTELKNLIVINVSSVLEMSKQLMDLHEWCLLPSFVVVDTTHLLSQAEARVSSLSASVMQRVTLCATSFLSYLHTICEQKAKQSKLKEPSIVHVYGLFVVKVQEGIFDENNLQLLKDLYFYKRGVMSDMKLITRIIHNDMESGSRP